MKAGIPFILICALGYGSTAMADCGDEDKASIAAEAAAPVETHAGPQRGGDRSAGVKLSTVPVERKFFDAQYEDEGYRP